MMTLRSQVLCTASSYALQRGISLSRISTIVFGDGKALRRIQSGGDLTTGTFERGMAWFSANWPEGVDWPADVPRPQPQETM
jgi:hypothetical protein